MPPPVQEAPESRGVILGQEDPLEEGVATHSNILAWRIPWTEEPGGLYIVHGVAKSPTRRIMHWDTWLMRTQTLKDSRCGESQCMPAT